MTRGSSRRWCLRRSLVAPATVLLAAVADGAVWRTVLPPSWSEPEGPVLAGRPDDYTVGDARRWPDGRFYLARLPDGFLALFDRCPHLGCPIPTRRDGVFECRCHFSRFALNGARITGPAERPMDLLPISLSAGQLVVQAGDSVAQRRTDYDASQVFRT